MPKMLIMLSHFVRYFTNYTAVIEAQCDLKYINDFREEIHVICDDGVAPDLNVSG